MNNTCKHNGYDQTCSYTCQWIIPMTSVRKTSLLVSSVLQWTVPTSVHMERLSIKPDGSMPPEKKKSKRSLNELTLKPCKEPIHLDLTAGIEGSWWKTRYNISIKVCGLERWMEEDREDVGRNITAKLQVRLVQSTRNYHAGDETHWTGQNEVPLHENIIIRML